MKIRNNLDIFIDRQSLPKLDGSNGLFSYIYSENDQVSIVKFDSIILKLI